MAQQTINLSTPDDGLGDSLRDGGDKINDNFTEIYTNVGVVAFTAAGRALTDDADNTAQRTTLGLGTVAVKNTGTSGDAIGVLNGASVTWAADMTINGRAVGTGGQTASTVLGGTVSSTSATALSNGASSAAQGLAAGQGATAAANSVSLGASSVSGASGVAIGFQASTSGFSGSMAFGRGATATAANQCVFGSETIPITAFYFGEGVTSTTPSNIVFNATGGSGTDIAGANFTIAGGRGTGAGTPGVVKIQTSTAAASSATLQTLADRATFDVNGATVVGAVVSSTHLKSGSFTVGTLPSAATAGAGAHTYASNGRKAGEGGGAGTGIPVWSDATNWLTYYDNTTAAA